MQDELTRATIPLLLRATCPHCWNRFPPEDCLWISEHPDLLGDPRLGTDHQQRFLPTRFDVSGAALDMRGFPCRRVACPKCHLETPRALLEMEPVFLSILGAPSCGKTYFLASMAWSLRKTLPRDFCLTFNDADPSLNRPLNEYEEQQFLSPRRDQLVALRKTEEQGDLYDTVLFGDQAVRYPRPFIFSCQPLAGHPNYGLQTKVSRALCLYDNAGESFLPGADTSNAPVTRHLAMSRAVLFLFDPTQDLRFRQACDGQTQDPQMAPRDQRLKREHSVGQHTVLLEAADRIRRHTGLGQHAKHGQPLIVVVTKYDAWSSLMGGEGLPRAWVSTRNSPMSAVDVELIEQWSLRVRDLLWRFCPEIVAAAEGFARHVIYVPVTALGRSPEMDAASGMLGIRPQDIQPQWVEVPLLYVLSRWLQGIVPYRRPKGDAA